MNGPALLSATCRPLAASSAARCSALHAACFSTAWPPSEFERLLTSSSVIADAIGDGPAFKGFVVSQRALDEAEILTIAVEPRARGKGLSTALLGNHLSRVARAGVFKIFLEVDESNTPALALYRRYGFRQVGRRPAYYAKPDGTKANALILRLNL